MFTLGNLSDAEMVEVCNQVESSFNDWFADQLAKTCECEFEHWQNCETSILVCWKCEQIKSVIKENEQ